MRHSHSLTPLTLASLTMPRTATTPQWIERGPIQRQIFCWSCGLCVLMTLLGWAATGSHVTIYLDRGKPHATALHLHNHRFLLFTKYPDWFAEVADSWPNDFLPTGTPIDPTPLLLPVAPQPSVVTRSGLFALQFDTTNERKARDTLGTPMHLSIVASSPWAVVLMAACVATATRPRRAKPWPAPRPWLTRVCGRLWPVSWIGSSLCVAKCRSSRWKHRNLWTRTCFWSSAYGFLIACGMLFVSTHHYFSVELNHHDVEESSWGVEGSAGQYRYWHSAVIGPIISENPVYFVIDGSWSGYAFFLPEPFNLEWTPLWDRLGSIALWIPPLVFLIPLLLTLPRRVRAGQCPCGYSLLGLTSSKCPECGRAVSRVNAPTNNQSRSTPTPPAASSESTP